MGDHDFVQDHNNLFKKNRSNSSKCILKLLEIVQEDPNGVSDILKEKSSNSVLVNNIEKKEEKVIEVINKNENILEKKEEKKSNDEAVDKDTKIKEHPLADRKEEQTNNASVQEHPIPIKKKENNACCNIL